MLKAAPPNTSFLAPLLEFQVPTWRFVTSGRIMSNLDDTVQPIARFHTASPILIPLFLLFFHHHKRPTVSLSTNLAQRQKCMALPPRHTLIQQ